MFTAIVNGKERSAPTAIKMRAKHGKGLQVACAECNRPARVHSESYKGRAHFEHMKRNRFCTLVHKPELSPAE